MLTAFPTTVVSVAEFLQYKVHYPATDITVTLFTCNHCAYSYTYVPLPLKQDGCRSSCRSPRARMRSPRENTNAAYSGNPCQLAAANQLDNLLLRTNKQTNEQIDKRTTTCCYDSDKRTNLQTDITGGNGSIITVYANRMQTHRA